MEKIIIDNRSDLDIHVCLNVVQSVINMGRISNDGKQYCYCSSFKYDGNDYMVSTDLNKKSDRFVIQNQ